MLALPSEPSSRRRRVADLGFLIVFVLTVSTGCKPTEQVARTLEASLPLDAQSDTAFHFIDVAHEVGLDAFRQVSGQADKLYLPASTGAGVCLFDADQDGDLDIFLINGSRIGGFELGREPTNRLFLNEGQAAAFRDVTADSGLSSHGAWGQGCAVADVNGDSFPDLYVTNYEHNAFYLNDGRGTFEEIAAGAGIDSAFWSTGASFIDIDRDRDLDLYVANFVRYDLVLAAYEGRRWITHNWKGLDVASGPMGLPAAKDQFFRNDSDPAGNEIRFTDISDETGVGTVESSYGFQPTLGDVNNDGFLDLFVANDSRPNFLWLNDRGHGFSENALALGLAYDRAGKNQACMGAAFDDHNGDGALDLFVTNFADELNTLYVADGAGFFHDDTLAAGLVGPKTQSHLAWGTFFFDADNNGVLDLFVANGHIYPQVEHLAGRETYAQANELFAGTPQGRYRDVAHEAGPGMAIAKVSRGAAFGDFDDDGDLDIVVNNTDDTPTVLRNAAESAGHWLKVELRGRDLNRSAIGARVWVEAAGRRHSRTRRSSESYLSHHDPRLHFGLGDAETVDEIVVDWPDGTSETLAGADVNQHIIVEQGRGIGQPVR